MFGFPLKRQQLTAKMSEDLRRLKSEIQNLPQGTAEYRKQLTAYLRLVLKVKANSYSLDAETERRLIVKLIIDCLKEINLIESANQDVPSFKSRFKSVYEMTFVMNFEKHK